MAETIRNQYLIPREIDDAIREKAFRERRSQSEIVREGMASYLGLGQGVVPPPLRPRGRRKSALTA